MMKLRPAPAQCGSLRGDGNFVAPDDLANATFRGNMPTVRCAFPVSIRACNGRDQRLPRFTQRDGRQYHLRRSVEHKAQSIA